MRKILQVSALLAALTSLGTFGIWFIEDDYDWFDALYMTVISLTTVGYSEIYELSTAGRAFLMVFLALGLGVFLYSLVSLGELIVSNQLNHWFENRKMDAALKSLRHHFIICGFGRMGQSLCSQLSEHNLPFVVVDRDADLLSGCETRGWHFLVGDATEDETLTAAGIEHARGLATVLGTDAGNLFVVFSARLLRPNLQILARASDPKQGEKLSKAGANGTVSPYSAGAVKLARLLANPHVENFIEIFTSREREFDLAEIQVDDDSTCAGKMLNETTFTDQGIVVIGIRKPDSELLMPPPSTTRLEPGDSFIALGRADAIQSLTLNK